MQQNEDLADLFKTERKRKGLSLREAAKLLDTGFGHLSDIETRKHANLTVKTLRRAQWVFDVSSRRIWNAACRSIEWQKEDVCN